MGIHEQFGASWEITDMRDILQWCCWYVDETAEHTESNEGYFK
jgi:hypothetical protein